jgi:hypothetical protein
MKVKVMTQFVTKVDFRTVTLNIGCMGEVLITVHTDGWWEIQLTSNRDRDRDQFFRTRGTMLPDNQLFCHKTLEIIELPEWMFTQFNDTIGELKIMIERDALMTPNVQGATA